MQGMRMKSERVMAKVKRFQCEFSGVSVLSDRELSFEVGYCRKAEVCSAKYRKLPCFLTGQALRLSAKDGPEDEQDDRANADNDGEGIGLSLPGNVVLQALPPQECGQSQKVH